MMKKVVIQKGKEKSLQRFHPWVFSGAIARKDSHIAEGEIVEVYDAYDNFLAMGHYHTSSISVRVFSFEQVNPDYAFWKKKIEQAIDYRKLIYLFDNENFCTTSDSCYPHLPVIAVIDDLLPA